MKRESKSFPSFGEMFLPFLMNPSYFVFRSHTTEYLYFSYNEIFTTLERLTELSFIAYIFFLLLPRRFHEKSQIPANSYYGKFFKTCLCLYFNE